MSKRLLPSYVRLRARIIALETLKRWLDDGSINLLDVLERGDINLCSSEHPQDFEVAAKAAESEIRNIEASLVSIIQGRKESLKRQLKLNPEVETPKGKTKMSKADVGALATLAKKAKVVAVCMKNRNGTLIGYLAYGKDYDSGYEGFDLVWLNGTDKEKKKFSLSRHTSSQKDLERNVMSMNKNIEVFEKQPPDKIRRQMYSFTYGSYSRSEKAGPILEEWAAETIKLIEEPSDK